jgi:hypothetical protein
MASWYAPLGTSRFAHQMPTGPKFQNLTGGRYGQWLVLFYAGVSRTGPSSMWQCRCNCGVERIVGGSELTCDRSKSCGCRTGVARVVRVPSRPSKTHGMFGTPEYGSWTSMIQRCCNPKAKGYHNYGGRGIRICAEWRASFQAFFAHVGRRPSPDHSIDRIDNEGHYEPGNVKWATDREQNSHRRDSRVIVFQGTSLTLIEWSRRLGMDDGTIASRLRRGWTVEDALTKPLGNGKHKTRH